jgi:hypothetical protein
MNQSYNMHTENYFFFFVLPSVLHPKRSFDLFGFRIEKRPKEQLTRLTPCPRRNALPWILPIVIIFIFRSTTSKHLSAMILSSDRAAGMATDSAFHCSSQWTAKSECHVSAAMADDGILSLSLSLYHARTYCTVSAMLSFGVDKTVAGTCVSFEMHPQ